MAGSYTFAGWIRLAWALALTRMLYPRARLIRRPLHLRGARGVDFGQRITIGRGARIEACGQGTCLRFGNDVEINDHVHIGAMLNVTIGNRVLIASRVFITDHNHGCYGRAPEMLRPSARDRFGAERAVPLADLSIPTVPPADRPLAVSPVSIEDDVWLGQGVCVMPGVTIGAGSVIGANAVVVTDIPPGSIAVGVPARVIRRYDPVDGWIAVS